MGRVYKGQENLKIRLTVGVDIAGALTLLIKYRKPDESEGSFTAISEDDALGIIYYDIVNDNDDIDQSGIWTFWAFVEFADGRTAPGKSIERTFYNEGA